jgi:sporulation protein YlmC with PRC-barrel domain
MPEDTVLLGLDVLDRQLIDSDGRLCGKVDDLVLEKPSDQERGSAPVVTHILAGPGALGDRLHGWMGRIARMTWRRINPDVETSSIQLPWSVVAKVDREVHLTVSSREEGLEDVEDWVSAHLISKIPGAESE